ncbi:MAG: radical SAM protein [Candidatus Electrothrix aestuarii]|uniref:Radical SAM protein n=1 Tax=Candidatus Electrothrix aestuarii TaxID=3062594 RepID=A0AAU8LXM5_9BACT|nr:radical SAM protein [Candidatus Electrothrix aestuarii]
MNHIFGPVNSRRLGRSLGVDLFQDKICTLNCIYCEVGATVHLTCKRAEYASTQDIKAEIDAYCLDQERIAELDFITVTASGEPSLHAHFGEILTHLKKTTAKPIAVLTNGTTLTDPQVRQEMSLADVVIPSLDSALPTGFRKIDRPAACINLDQVIDGLVTFSHQYKGKIWLEILLAQGINDSNEEVEALRQAIQRMRLDRIQLNTVARPPLESFARPLDKKSMEAIAYRFREDAPLRPVDLLAFQANQDDESEKPPKFYFNLDREADKQSFMIELVEMLKRRPCTAADINRTFHLGGAEKVELLLDTLVQDGRIQKRRHGDSVYYQ